MVDERERDLGRGMGEEWKEGRTDILFDEECRGVRVLGGRSEIGEEGHLTITAGARGTGGDL